MGNESSSTGGYGEEEHPEDRFDGIDTLGYRVLGVQPNSPASTAGLVSFFDFLVGCNGRMLLGRSIDEEGNEISEDDEDYDDVDFPALLRESIGTELDMLVWNIKSQTQRIVKLTPSTSWGGTGLLGVTIRLDDYAEADERLIRVLSVQHNSPAAIAGLEPETDYLLGTTTVSFDDDVALAAVLRQHVDRVVELYVYNTESDVVRVVTLMPTLSWGGQGLLGAEVGTGYLHRLPHQCRGTLGSSVERKVRTGAARPTQQQQQQQQQGQHGQGVDGAKAPGAPANTNGSSTGGGADANGTSTGLVDLTASCSQDTEIRLEPQLELEPDPDDPGGHHRAAFAVAELHAAAAAQEQQQQKEEVEESTPTAGEPALKENQHLADQNEQPADGTKQASAGEGLEDKRPPPKDQCAAVPPPPPPAPSTSVAKPSSSDKPLSPPFNVPPPPPPPPAALPPPPQLGAPLQASPYMPKTGDSSIPPPPPPPGQFGLSPPPIAHVPDSPDKHGNGEVDLP